MTKNKTQNAKNQRKVAKMLKKQPKRPQGMRPPGFIGPMNKDFGAVSTVDTAPVAIGNSMRGSKQQVRNNAGGVIVKGRDFMFNPIGSNAITTWCTVGGTPLTPAAFSDSVIRGYLQMYQKFRWRSCVVHYITSSPTTASGDVMFYYNKNRDSTYLNQTSTQLLPFVMSDPDTVIGPQWTNHSTILSMKGTWKSTDYGMSADINEFSEGELFLLSKTSTTDSPGYVIFDYVIEFAQLQVSPRLNSLPLSRAQYTNVNFNHPSATTTANSSIALPNGGLRLDGGPSVLPIGATAGDIYKVVFDITNSAPNLWTGATPPTPANLASLSIFGGNTNLTLTDGTTIYAVYNGTNFGFYTNDAAAFAGGNDQLQYQASSLTVVFNLQAWISLVGTASSVNVNPNF